MGPAAAQSWLRKKEQEKSELKRAGRSRDFKRSHGESSMKFQSRSSTRGRGECYVCGSKEHNSFKCPGRADTDDREKKKSSIK